MFTVSGAVAQWYFAPAGTLARGAPWRSLAHALGPSLGSLSLGAMVLALLAYARLLLDRFRQERSREGLLAALWDCCTSCVIDLFQYLTKFATVGSRQACLLHSA